MNKASKVPTMSKDRPYEDWKKELQVWEVANNILSIDKKVRAAILFQSLEGLSRQTVLSELSVEEITAEDGVNNIISTLDEFFLGNQVQDSYNAIDELLSYRCNKEDTLENFIIQFNLRVNKVKASGTVLPEGVLGYALLNSANLPSEKHDMVRATCSDLGFKNVKIQLEKIGLIKSESTNLKFSSSQSGTPKVKVENCFYGNTPTHQDNYRESSSSEEDANGEKVFYSKTTYPGSSGKTKYNMNPADRFGHTRACSFCKCLYHWLIDCPYAPPLFKNNMKAKEAYSKNPKTL